MDDSTTRPAEYSMVLDLVSHIAALDSEDAAIERLLELFTELCAPASLVYVAILEGAAAAARCRPVGRSPAQTVERLCRFSGSWAETDSGAGFILVVQHAGERLGVLEVEGIAFPEQRSHFLSLALKIVEVLGLAIANARLHERVAWAQADARAERDHAADLLGLSDAINTINATIVSTLDFDEIMRRVVVAASEATRADYVGLLRRGDEGWDLAWGEGYDEGWLGRTFSADELPFVMRAATQRDVLWDNDAAEAFTEHPQAVFGDIAGSVMSVPLILKGEVFGVLSFKSLARNAFTSRHVDFASKLASSLSLALQNSMLFEAQRTIADTLQQALLVMPKRVRGIEFGNLYHASSREAAFAGGDFYDLFEIDHRTVGVVIGDISGKGLEAAKLTSLVKDAIRAYTHIGTSPQWVIENTNVMLFEATDDTTFATLFLGIIDTPTGTITYCNAGHPTALIRATDGNVRGLAVGSTVIGAFQEMDAREGTETLSPGEVLVLYTDGITEARCKEEFFGEERLVQIVSTTSVPTAAMPEALMEMIRNCEHAELPDDVAILCLALEWREPERHHGVDGQLSLTE